MKATWCGTLYVHFCMFGFENTAHHSETGGLRFKKTLKKKKGLKKQHNRMLVQCTCLPVHRGSANKGKS